MSEPYVGGKLETFKPDPNCANCKGSGIEPGSGESHGMPYGIDPGSYEPCFCVFCDCYVDESIVYPQVTE